MKGHPIFAALYDFILGPAERKFFGPHRAYLAGRATGRVLDVGSGTGANFTYYPPGVEVVGIEPDPYMLRRAQDRADRLGGQIKLLADGAEQQPFADASFDVAVVTLVFCTVPDLDRALGELRRVLRPEGQLRFLEHVRAKTPGWQRFQDIVTPLWKRIGAGCHPTATRWSTSSEPASTSRSCSTTRTDRTLFGRSCAVWRCAHKKEKHSMRQWSRASTALLAVLMLLAGPSPSSFAGGGFEHVHALAMDAGGRALFLGGHTGLFRSEDGGRSWQKVPLSAKHPHLDVMAIAVDPKDRLVLYVGTHDAGVFRSTDGGTTWKEVNAGLGGLDVHGLAIDPNAPSKLHAAVREKEDGVYRTTDGGGKWVRVDDGPGGEVKVLTSVNIPTGMGGIYLYAGTAEGLQRNPDCF